MCYINTILHIYFINKYTNIGNICCVFLPFNDSIFFLTLHLFKKKLVWDNCTKGSELQIYRFKTKINIRERNYINYESLF